MIVPHTPFIPASRHRVYPMSATYSAQVGYSRLAAGIQCWVPAFAGTNGNVGAGTRE